MRIIFECADNSEHDTNILLQKKDNEQPELLAAYKDDENGNRGSILYTNDLILLVMITSILLKPLSTLLAGVADEATNMEIRK